MAPHIRQVEAPHENFRNAFGFDWDMHACSSDTNHHDYGDYDNISVRNIPRYFIFWVNVIRIMECIK